MVRYYSSWNMKEAAFDHIDHGLWIRMYSDMIQNRSDLIMTIVRDKIRDEQF